MVEDAVRAKRILLLLTMIGFCGCNRAASYITVSGPSNQLQSPTTIEPAPENSTPPSTSAAPAPENSVPPSTSAAPAPENSVPPSTSAAPAPKTASTPIVDQPHPQLIKEDVEDPPEPALEAEEPLTENSALTPMSSLIRNASWVMLHEGKKLGTACNAFVRRVLEISGFSPADFLANDFDLYAKKYIRSYKAVDFKNDVAGGAEIARLKSHLWSYPERTPFIMQWSSSGMHGHIAIVERIKDQLIIYQANLNKYTARKGTTTVQSLLSGFNRSVLTVYTELKK